jgi:hypothetical protein
VFLDAIGLTASKPGYWNAGVQVFDPLAPQIIELRPITLVDDPTYAFKSADDGTATPYCTHCHVDQVADWQGSAHARAASDPQLHDLYNGTASGITDAATCIARGGRWQVGKAYGVPGSIHKCYVGPGVLPDLNAGVCGGPGTSSCDDPGGTPPTAVSVCADCHAPANPSHVAGATDLNTVAGIAFDEGVTCDLCHKIRSVAVDQRPGRHGAITLARPPPASPGDGFSDPEIMFGPYGDTIAFFMGGAVQPQFRTSELCSACHQWSEAGFRPADQALIDPVKWPLGLPLQDTYDEWASTAWAAAGVHCQTCHMPASRAGMAALDEHALPPSPEGNVGWLRPYGAIRRHLFRARVPQMKAWSPPPGEPGLDVLRAPLAVDVQATRANGQLAVNVSIGNTGAGHAFPSGTPSRALFVLVHATAGTIALPAIAGQTVPEWTGALAAGVLAPGRVWLESAALVFAGGVPADLQPGAIVRFARATSAWADDPGVGWFGRPERTPPEKGLPIWTPAGEAVVIALQSDRLVLDRVLHVPAGARFMVGGPAIAGVTVDAELPGVALAGAPGWVFGKVMAAADGSRGVPFWRAIDIAADNRIPAGATATTHHVFDATGAGAQPITVTVTLLYRRHPFTQAHLRGWNAVDVVRAVTTIVVD